MTAQKDIPSKSSVTPYEATVIGGGGGGSGDAITKVEYENQLRESGRTILGWIFTYKGDTRSEAIYVYGRGTIATSLPADDIIKWMSANWSPGQTMVGKKLQVTNANLYGFTMTCTGHNDETSTTTFNATGTIVVGGTAHHLLGGYVAPASASNPDFQVAITWWDGSAEQTATIGEADILGVDSVVGFELT